MNLHLSKNTGENKAQNEYASILGSLMYVMNCTRPDIACAVSKLSRFTVSPNENHWKAIKRLLGYLKHTQDYSLHYTEYPVVLEGYCDANWITGTKRHFLGYLYSRFSHFKITKFFLTSLHIISFCAIILQVEFVGVLRSVPLRRNEIRSILGDDCPLSSVQVEGPNSS